MSFYINDFKQHLQNLADNVDKPYDEPASHKSAGGSLEEAYVKMKQPSMGSFQRPAPTQLNEQGMPGVPGLGGPAKYTQDDSTGQWVKTPWGWRWQWYGGPDVMTNPPGGGLLGGRRSAGGRGFANRQWKGQPNLGGGIGGGGMP